MKLENQVCSLGSAKRLKELGNMKGFQVGHKLRVGMKHSEEAKKKISASNKGRVSPMKGKSMPESAKQAISKTLKGKPILKIRGEKHYNWKDGRTKLQKIIRHLVEYRNWRENIFQRDNFSCVECRKIGGDLNADHYPVAFSELLDKFQIKNVEQALGCSELWKIETGRTLCLDCHRKTFKFWRNQYVTA